MNIKYGLKLWSKNYHSLGEAKKLIESGILHYIELMVIPDSDIFPFYKVNLPYIIHIPHEGFGFNLADKKREKFNFKMISQSITWADKLSAKCLILHTGFGEIETALNFLEKVNDKRILIENEPKVGVNDEKMIGYTPGQVKVLAREKFGFCLDFGHAVKAALSLKLDYKEYVKSFLDLKPKVFHISDGALSLEKDEHLNIGEGEYDFEFLLNCIEGSESGLVTLETPKKNLNSFDEDLENIKKLNAIRPQ